MKFKALFVLGMFCLSLGVLFVPDDAEAQRRMGGGRSFGSSSRMEKPAPRPTTTAPATTMQRSQPTQQNQAAVAGGGAAAATSRGGMGMMGGLMGGLLAGSLLGSLLMGGGFAGGSFLDLILIGLLVFIGYKIFTRVRSRQSQASTQQSSSARNNSDSWDTLHSVPATQKEPHNMHSSEDAPSSNVESDELYASHFDKAEFLRGAKILYIRLQESWDKRDLEDIAEFSTEAVMKELRKQNEEDPNPSQTDILVVNAYLQEISRDGIFERAAVHFNVRLREDPTSEETQEVDELWHFIRNADAKDVWKLDGIQQIQ